ncbi:MAG: type VI secretion system contractile sheath large subunit [Rubrivivax sp.]
MPGRMEFELSAGRPPARRRAEGAAMRLLVMGDFSGLPAAERPPLATRPTHAVDVDSLDVVLRRLAPRAATAAGACRFESIDDFHPDALLQRLPTLAALRAQRDGPPPAAGEDPLSLLLGRKAAPDAAPAVAAPAPTGLDALLRQVVAPHIVPDRSATTAAWQAGVDAALGESLRAVLHDPAFQALEAAWRGVQWMIASLELDESLQLHVLDVTRDELLADVVAAQGKLAQTGLHHALADRWRNQPGGEGWAAVVALSRFGPGDTDIGLLAALGLVASQAGGPLLAEADPSLADGEATSLAGWHALRRSEAAPWIGLAAPRVLLRVPYGKAGEPLSGVSFEEFPGGTPTHDHLLWANPGLAVALLIARAFTARGWAFEPGDEREIGDLPAVTLLIDGEKALQPCAERWLGEHGAQAMLDAGLMPLASHRHRNAVTLARLQSIAAPAQALAGAWSAG